MASDATPRLEVWVAHTPFTPDLHVVLTAGLIEELRREPDDPRRTQLAEIVSERYASYSGQPRNFMFEDIVWERSISRVRAGETSLV